MPVVTLPITNGYYKTSSKPLSDQELLNCYVKPQQAPAMAQEAIFSIQGLTQLATSANGACRGAHVMDGVAYFVHGSKLQKLVKSGLTYSLTEIGTIAGAGRVSMADNGTQLLILVPSSTGYIYNKTTDTLVTITDSDFTANGNPTAVVFIDGYFVLTTDEKKFITSAINNGLSYNALDFGSAASSPDEVVAPIVFRNQLFIAGGQTLEGFQNIGGADFPFQRTGLFIQKGVYARFSLINTQDSFMFIGGGVNEGAAVWVVAGNSAQRISTDAIDLLLQDLTKDQLEDVYAWTYSLDGSYFVGFALPTVTIVYDFTSNKWHTRQSYISEGLQRYRVSQVLQVDNDVIAADIYDSRVGKFSEDVYTEYGNPIVRQFSTQPFLNNMNAIFVPMMELTVESGVGNSDREDPVVTMDRSTDGKNWQTPRDRKMGKIGEYNRRAIWYRNGRASRFETFRFACSAPVKFVVMQLRADIQGGTK